MNYMRGIAVRADMRRVAYEAPPCRRCREVACDCGQEAAQMVLSAAGKLPVPQASRAGDDGQGTSPAAERWQRQLDRARSRRLTAAEIEGLAREAAYLGQAFAAVGRTDDARLCDHLAETARRVAQDAMP